MTNQLISIRGKGLSKSEDQTLVYWNDKEEEKNKAFNIKDFGFEKIESEYAYVSLYDQLKTLIKKYSVQTKGSEILSVASGTCWLEGRWLKDTHFKRLSCIDFSKHRIHEIAPLSMMHYGIKKNVRYLHGSIFDLNERNTKYDIILLSQAFHHIDEPIALMRYLKKILSKKGIIIIIGEQYYTQFEYHKRALKHVFKYILNWKDCRRLQNFYPEWQDLFRPDFVKGDIHWSRSAYDFIFKKAGLTYLHDVHSSKLYQSFVVKKNSFDQR